MASARPTVSLSLRDAILLAVRSNPHVLTSQLTYAAQKFNTCVQQWEFYPHYNLQAGAIAGPNGYNISPSVSLQTPIGTQLSLTQTNSYTDHVKPGLSLQIVQPLLRGFGSAVVEAALNNAKDTELISKLNVEGALRGTVTEVIHAYLDVVAAEKQVEIDRDAIKRAEVAVTQTKLYIKAGHKAGNEIVTVKANVASAKTQYANDKNMLWRTRYALLTAIGVDPNAPIRFTELNLGELSMKYHLPSLEEAKRLVLKNDIQYQVDQITLHGPTSRNVLLAEDNARWQLNLTGVAATGNGTVGLFNGVNQQRSIGLVLQVPINDQTRKQAVVNATIAMKQAELALKQERFDKETAAINHWNTVNSVKLAWEYAQEAEAYQAKTYHVSYQKYMHGLIDSLELQTAQLQWIQAQQILLAARVNYLKALVSLDYLTGHTLVTWQLKTRLE